MVETLSKTYFNFLKNHESNTVFQKLRERWEGDREVALTLVCLENLRILVVIKNETTYDLFRYFIVGLQSSDLYFEVSSDGQNIEIDEVFKWIKDPMAIENLRRKLANS